MVSSNSLGRAHRVTGVAGDAPLEERGKQSRTRELLASSRLLLLLCFKHNPADPGAGAPPASAADCSIAHEGSIYPYRTQHLLSFC